MRIRLRLHTWLTTSLHRALNRRTALADADKVRVGSNLYAVHGYANKAADLGVTPVAPAPAPAKPSGGPTRWEVISLAGNVLTIAGFALLLLQQAGCLHLPHPGPRPVPPAPAPVDPLAQSIRAAYAAETDAGKAQDLATLATLYGQFPAFAHDQTLTTWGDLFTKTAVAVRSANLWGKLMGVQKVIQADLTAQFPTDPKAALDPPGRDKAANEFTRIGKALGDAAK